MMRRRSQGFTLIEIMVVVVIAAILMGAVILSFPQSERTLLKDNVNRFSLLLSLAQDEAIIQSRDMALAIDDAGYVYYRRTTDGWDAYSEGSFIPRRLIGGIPSDLYLEGIGIKLKPQDKTKPQIIISASGEVTPFKYVLGEPDASNITITVNAVGAITQVFKEVESVK